MDLKNLSSNWKKLQASGKIQKANSTTSATSQANNSNQHAKAQDGSLKRKRSDTATASRHTHGSNPKNRARKMPEEQAEVREFVIQDGSQVDHSMGAERQKVGERVNEGLAEHVDVGKYLALDCEMVGVGPHPHLESALARVSIVNYNGDQVYDSYVKPQEEVTDWRTHVSGIQPKHMAHARSLEDVQADITTLLKNRIVVGHSLRGDFDAMFLDHPQRDIRDTAKHPPFRKLAGGGSPKLKILASELLGLDIQAGEHSSIEDARATMLLFRKDKDAFEREHMKKWGTQVIVKKTEKTDVNDKTAKKSKKKKKKKR